LSDVFTVVCPITPSAEPRLNQPTAPHPPTHPPTHCTASIHNPLPPSPGWSLDFQTGRLFINPNARSAAAAALVRGGQLNAPARQVLANYDVPIIGGYDYSVPLSIAHPAMRGTKGLDCLHYCSYGLPEVRVGVRVCGCGCGCV